MDAEPISRSTKETSHRGRQSLRLAHEAGGRGKGDDLLTRLHDILGRAAEANDPHPANGNVAEPVLEAARRELRARRERERVFGPALTLDPAWDILLHLFVAGEEGRQVCAFAVCGETAVPEATLLRCVAHLASLKLLVRQPHGGDPRNIYLMLSQAAKARMCDYFTRSAAG
jgi:hypothetical protein